MKEIVFSVVDSSERKIITTDDLMTEIMSKIGRFSFDRLGGYQGFHQAVKSLVKEERLLPVKASKFNGLNPPLYNRYRKPAPKSCSGLKDELYLLSPPIKIDYYLKHPKAYIRDKKYILALDAFLRKSNIHKILKHDASVNERSFQIFNDEKFLLSSQGRKFLKNIGIDYIMLNCYETYEPFFYIFYKNTLENVGLIVENKDTFYSIKRVFSVGRRQLNGIVFNLLIYGEGNKILRSFNFINEIIENLGSKDVFFYFGDLDHKGVEIFIELKRKYPEIRIFPAVILYKLMINRYKDTCPTIRTRQKPIDAEEFLGFFDSSTAGEIKKVLSNKKYIPQEALNYGDFLKLFVNMGDSNV
jgi:hypothetical protein